MNVRNAKLTRLAYAGLTVLVCVGLTGCPPTSGGGSGSGGGGTPDPYGPGTLVYGRSGGILGVIEELRITADRNAVYTSNRFGSGSEQISQSEYDGLIDLVRAADFYALPDAFRSPVVVADGFAVGVTYDFNGRAKSVSSETGATTPASYDALVRALAGIADRLRAANQAARFEYTAAGGLLGFDERLEVAPDRTATLTSGSIRTPTFTNSEVIPQAEYDELMRLARVADFFNLPDEYDFPPGVILADGLGYTVTVSQAGRTKTVRSKTGAVEDQVFTDLRLALNQIATRLRVPPRRFGAGPIGYRYSGGIAGFDDLVEIGIDRVATLNGDSLTLDQSEYDQLIDEVEASDFFNLADRYVSPTPIFDGLAQTTTYEFGGNRKQVIVSTGGNPPPGLGVLLSHLGDIRARLRAGSTTAPVTAVSATRTRSAAGAADALSSVGSN